MKWPKSTWQRMYEWQRDNARRDWELMNEELRQAREENRRLHTALEKNNAHMLQLIDLVVNRFEAAQLQIKAPQVQAELTRMMSPEALPPEVVAAIAERAEPRDTMYNVLVNYAWTELHAGKKPSTVVEHILKGSDVDELDTLI